MRGAYECSLIAGPVFLHPGCVMLRTGGGADGNANAALPDFVVFTELLQTSQPLMEIDRVDRSKQRGDTLMQDEAGAEEEQKQDPADFVPPDEQDEASLLQRPTKTYLRGCSVVRPDWILRFAPTALLKVGNVWSPHVPRNQIRIALLLRSGERHCLVFLSFNNSG